MFDYQAHSLRPGCPLFLDGLTLSSAVFLQSRFFRQSGQSLVFVTPDLKTAYRAKEIFSFYLPLETQVELFIPWDVHPYFHLSPNPEVLARRMQVLWQMLHQNSPSVYIVPVGSLVRKLMPRRIFESRTMVLSLGDEIERNSLISRLSDLGYERVPLVEDFSTFAVRGNLIDIFPPSLESPVRLEFMGDTLESLRLFDAATQKTNSILQGVPIIPARETLMSELPDDWSAQLKKIGDARDISKSDRNQVAEYLENQIQFSGIETFLPLFYSRLDTVFDYLPQNTHLSFFEATAIFENIKKEIELHEQHFSEASSIEKLMEPSLLYLSHDEAQQWLELSPVVYINHHSLLPSQKSLSQNHTLASDETSEGVRHSFNVQTNALLEKQLKARIHSESVLDPLVTAINQHRLEGTHIFLVASTPSQKERLVDLLKRYKLPLSETTSNQETSARVEDAVLSRIPGSLVNVVQGSLYEGFYWPDEKQWWIADDEIFGKKGRRVSTAKKSEVFSSFSELAEGDYIVHLDHGVGIYRGLITLTLNGKSNDLLQIEYLGGDKLYVPVDKLNRVCRYSANDESRPMLDKMGGTAWQKTKDKVKSATRKLARDLLEIQAARQSQKGFSFSAPDEMYEEFEATFPFEETPDQLDAIEDVLKDMQKPKPMDRLVCGDVGFGKTEVAIRAAFKAVCDRKQVAVLVPTTVLAFQHYENFKKRFASYPLSVEMLCRFRSRDEQKEIVEKLNNGKIDIVVATHRLLSNDVSFRDLGLLIVDEEHRFGVAQKEKIKKIRNLVDLLTLSATPIPRTLNFSLVGIRDLSIINTPPVDRLAIRTMVTYFDDVTIREAILHEVQRGGQVYFVHNRVQSIYQMQERLQSLVPSIRIGVGHGQMGEEALEDVMIKFMNKEYDLLLCTTIIESGLDIPSANTMIINRADHMGLAQLYQLRGRVGRSNHRAFCYLIIPEAELLKEDARKRLQVIQRFTELGSGFKIASHDMEIRGAGNILGAEQSGNMAAIGYDFYVSLLKQAVEEMQGRQLLEDLDPELKFDVEALIPQTLIPDAGLRLTLYKELSGARDLAEIEEVRAEWIDRFGTLPDVVENLILLIKVKLLAKQLRLVSLTFRAGHFVMALHSSSPIPTEKIMALVAKSPKKYQILPEGKLQIRDAAEGNVLRRCLDMLIGWLTPS